MSGKIFIEVVTPERAVLAGEADEVILPGSEGQLGILPGHLPLLTGLDIGEMTIKGFSGKHIGADHSGTRKFFVDGGFVEVLPNKVSVMTETCDGFDAIDVEAAKIAIEKAERDLLSLEEVGKGELIEAEILQRHQEALKKARMRLICAEEGNE